MNEPFPLTRYHDRFDWLDLSVVAYLVLPVPLFLWGWVKPVIALPLLGGLVWYLVAIMKRVQTRPHCVPSGFLVCLVFALLVTYLNGAGGLLAVDSQNDWNKHDAMFLDLATRHWPVTYDIGDTLIYLRYYTGLYLVPAALAKVFGLASLNFTVTAWVALGYFLLFSLLARRVSGTVPLVVVCAVVLLFSGQDILRALVFHDMSAVLEGSRRVSPDFDPAVSLNVFYPPNLLIMLQMPQHFLAASLPLALLVQQRENVRFVSGAGVMLAAMVLWSPLAGLGVVPFAMCLAVTGCLRGSIPLRDLFSASNLLLGLPVMVLVVVYLASGVSSLPAGWIWQYNSAAKIAVQLPWLYATEFAITVLLLLWLRPGLLREPMLWVAVALLVALPLFRYGALNDLQRASVPALFLLSLWLAETLSQPAAFSRRKMLLAWLVFLLGSLSAWHGIDRQIERYVVERKDYTALDRSIPTTMHPIFAKQYYGRHEGRLAQWVLKP